MFTPRHAYFGGVRFLLFIGSLCGLGLGHSMAQPNALVLKAEGAKNHIQLRWAPSNYATWDFSNTYGFQLFRSQWEDKGSQSGFGPTQLISTIVPADSSQWITAINSTPEDEQQWLLIGAQATFRSELALMGTEHPLVTLQLVEQNEQRFSMALLSADRSMVVAKLMGLHYTDTVAAGNKFLYEIKPLVPDSLLTVEPGFVFATAEYIPLPLPPTPQVSFHDNWVEIGWDAERLGHYYSAYRVERSLDRKEFEHANRAPVPVITGARHLHYVDSLPDNETLVYYRIVGLTPFGSHGPPSKVVHGHGRPNLNARARIANHEITPENKIILQWNALDNQAVIGIDVMRSPDGMSGFLKLNHQPIEGDTLFTDHNPLSTGYYKLRTIGIHGQELESHPYQVQLPDSIPPPPPKSLSGVMDTSGVVSLSWIEVPDNDLLGYRVYRSNFLSNEFSLISNVIKDTFFLDSLVAGTLNEYVYYKVKALDGRFNASDYSNQLRVEVTDLVGPPSPSLKQIISTTHGPKISWTSTSSQDLKSFILQKLTLQGWQDVYTGSANVFVDSMAENGSFEYRLYAIDTLGNASIDTVFFTARRLTRDDLGYDEVNIERVEKDILLQWNTSVPTKETIVYRKIDEAQLSWYASIGDDTVFRDQKVQIGHEYTYRIRSLLQNGNSTGLSPPLIIKM